MLSRCLVIALLTLAVACASTTPVMLGTARQPVPADQVIVYNTPPPSYEVIANLTASSKSLLNAGGEQQMSRLVLKLKQQAARLGANGLILEGFSSSQTASLGTGVGSQSYSSHSAVGVGVGGSLGIFKDTGRAQAIFVPAP